MTIAQRIKEAETYLSMGMLDESLAVYTGLLDSQDLEPGTSQQLRQKANDLKQSIEQRQREQADTVQRQSPLIEQATDDTETPANLLAKASAFKELGLLREAAEAYENLLLGATPATLPAPGKAVIEWLGCALKTMPVGSVIKRLKDILDGDLVPTAEKVQILLGLAKEMEKRDQKPLAEELINIAAQFDPAHPEIGRLLETGQAPVQSRYDYLLRNQIVTSTQLQHALEAGKQKDQSVESILIGQYRVAKEQIGQSLSAYYRCDFKEFDPNRPIPVELMGKLKKAFLLHYVWVPLAWDKQGIEILVDDPNDLRKTDHIRALMNSQKVTFCVGIKEDIVQYIEHFYSPRPDETVEENLDSLETFIPDISFEEELEPDDKAEVVDESSSQIVKFVDQVLITAFRERVSDIHIEPSPVAKTTTIRFRMDGVCHEYRRVPNAMAPATGTPRSWNP